MIIEIVNRSHKPIERHRYKGERCQIGRSYDNDLILSEAHVSPHHAVLEQDAAGQCWLVDQSSKNGIRNRRHKPVGDKVKINSGDEFILGKVHLKFFAPDHSVVEAMGLGVSENSIYALSHPLQFVLFSLFAVTVFALYEYNQTFNQLEAREFLPNVLGVLLAGVFWASIWAVAGRIFRHEPRFVAQCIVSFCYLILMQVAELIVQAVAYNSGSLWLTNSLLYLIYGGLMVLLLTYNLRLATHQTSLSRIVTANSLAWGVIATVWLFTVFSRPEFNSQPVYSGSLQSPVMRWRSSVTVEEFQNEAAFIFSSTD